MHRVCKYVCICLWCVGVGSASRWTGLNSILKWSSYEMPKINHRLLPTCSVKIKRKESKEAKAAIEEKAKQI